MFFLRDDFEVTKSTYTVTTRHTNDVTFSPSCIEMDQSPNILCCGNLSGLTITTELV